jgi:hypothetical protein
MTTLFLRTEGILRMVARWNGRRTHLPNGFMTLTTNSSSERPFSYVRQGRSGEGEGGSKLDGVCTRVGGWQAS